MTLNEIPMTDTIDAATFRQLRDDPLVRVLDVRTGGEFESAHIPGSYNGPLDTLVGHVGEFALVERPIVLVCQSGGRAGHARQKLAAAGKTTLHILDGGINAWITTRGEITSSGRQRWALDRQVDSGRGRSQSRACSRAGLSCPRSGPRPGSTTQRRRGRTTMSERAQ